SDCAREKLECDFVAHRFSELVAEAAAQTSAAAYFWSSRAYNELAKWAFDRLQQLPPSVELHQLRAGILTSQKHYREAAGEWREALKLAPSDRDLQRELGVALDLNGQHEQARSLLEELLRGEPNSVELNYLLGDTYLNMQRPKQAIPLLKKAVERD